MKIEEIADNLHMSKGYVSMLLTVAKNKDLLGKVKEGSLTIRQAYEKSLTVKQESEETRYKEKPNETAPIKAETQSLIIKQESQEKQPLTDEDLGITTSLKQALEEGKRFKPLSPDDLKLEAEPRKTEYMTCDYCGRILSRLDVKWIKVHSEEYDKVLLAIHSLAERETRNGSSQP
ncbi:MAG: hypothetical protein QXJ07_04860 [Candidatus Bathyarchaeia archaeon]